MIQSNPYLSQLANQNPQLLSMMTDPSFIQTALQMSSMFQQPQQQTQQPNFGDIDLSQLMSNLRTNDQQGSQQPSTGIVKD
jgi:cytochrome bd-type quinol oxidase subunit 1